MRRTLRTTAVLAVACLSLAGCGSTTSDGSGNSSTSTKASAADVAGTPIGDGVNCTKPPALPTPVTGLTLPDKGTAAGKTFVATVTTNCGDLTFELDGAKAPQTVASFLQLAKKYWDDSPCQRLTTSGIWVIQCGDPTGSGRGNPGYGFGIENAPADGDYPTGTLAMARTPDPNSNGGQFFIVYQDTQLPVQGGGYSIFGKVTGGMPILNAVAAGGTDNSNAAGDGHPIHPISILKISVTEKKA